MADPAWLEVAERTLNRRVQASETAVAHLQALAPRRFGLRLKGLPWALSLRAAPDWLYLELAGEDATFDVEVSGSIVAIGALAAGRGARLIRDGTVELRGDGEIAERFEALLQAIGPDWEEELARWLGDIAAHQLARPVRAAGRFATKAADTLARDLAEYLQEEAQVLINRHRQEEFLQAVDDLRDGVERLAARIARLERRARPRGDGA